jgi:hypothetical protein
MPPSAATKANQALLFVMPSSDWPTCLKRVSGHTGSIQSEATDAVQLASLLMQILDRVEDRQVPADRSAQVGAQGFRVLATRQFRTA